MNYSNQKNVLKLLRFLLLPVIVFSSCKKDTEWIEMPSSVAGAAQKKIVERNREIAAILEKVYVSPEAYYEVAAGIYAEYYEDERVLLKDLLFPETSALYQSENFKGFNTTPGSFKKLFMEELSKGNYPVLSSALSISLSISRKEGSAAPASTNTVSLVDQDIFSDTRGAAIYFPYAENFNKQFKEIYAAVTSRTITYSPPTVVATDREGDTGVGREQYVCGSRLSLTPCYRTVTVDDNYAFVRSTHIVTSGAELKTDNAVVQQDTPEPMNRIYHGWSMLSKQMDRLLSLTGNGGGSEIKVARINGYLQTKDQQVTSFSGDVVTLHYKRGDIRRKKWRRIFSVWDMDWKTDDKEQVYAVYEEDTQGTKKFKGVLTTTLNLPGKPSLGKVVAEVGFDVSVLTQDEIITQKKQDRYSYYRDAFNSQGWGYVTDPEDFLPVGKDWPIFDGGTVWQYSLPYRVY